VPAELIRDLDRRDGWLLKVAGVAQSYVDLTDPTHLEFEYMRWLGDVVDLIAPAGEPIAAVHVGGGACTLARYVAATRPGSRQLAYEPDGQILELVRTKLRLQAVRGLRVRVVDGAVGLPRLRPASNDLVVTDAFDGWAMPARLRTVRFAAAVARVLRPGGVYAVNVADGRRLAFARAEAATLAEVFRHVAVIGEPGVLRGRRFGNLVLAASSRKLPVAALARRAARVVGMARVVAGPDLAGFIGAARPVLSGENLAQPAPPAALLVRR
jgi:spermidine synthase